MDAGLRIIGLASLGAWEAAMRRSGGLPLTPAVKRVWPVGNGVTLGWWRGNFAVDMKDSRSSKNCFHNARELPSKEMVFVYKR